MYLRQPRFTYSACRSFTKNKGRMQKSELTGDSRYIYQSELEKAYLQEKSSSHDMMYGHFGDLPKKIASDKLFS